MQRSDPQETRRRRRRLSENSCGPLWPTALHLPGCLRRTTRQTEPTLSSPTRSVRRGIEAFDSVGVAARRVLPDALSWSNKSSIIGSGHERSSVCSGTPTRIGARPAERVAGQVRAPGERSTQPLRRRCAALAGAKPARTTDSPHSAPAAQLAHALRGAPAIRETAPACHRHRRRPPGHTVVSHAIADHLSNSSRHIR